MGSLFNLYRRECSSYFNSPIAYILIVGCLLVLSFIFFPFLGFFKSSSPDFRAYFENVISFAFFTAVFIPLVTMRLWSEEKKQGTQEVLLTLPLKTGHVVLAKFFAAYTVVAATVLLTLVVPLTISSVLDLDWGAIVSNYIGILLISAVYVAIGAAVSALTENQIVAFMIALIVSALICFIGYPPVIQSINENLGGLGDKLGNFGTYFHYQNFAKGLISAVDIIYAVSMTVLFLFLNNIFVESRKY